MSPTHAILASLELGDAQPVRLVGAINVSPESFFPDSVSRGSAELAERARQMEAEGADVIDLGAMSTAPYLETHIDAEEERRRMEWAVTTVVAAVRVPVSADTQRASVAAVALAAGARIINDVSGLRADPKMANIAAQAEGLILSASEVKPSDEEPIDLCRRLLAESLAIADRAGTARQRIVLDPGIGFFRRARLPWDRFDLAILRDLGKLHDLGSPILVGISRKSFIGKITGRKDVADRLPGSLAAAAIAVVNGAHAVRAHDIAATRDAIRVAEAIARGTSP